MAGEFDDDNFLIYTWRWGYREYKGPVWRTDSSMKNMLETKLAHIKGRVVLDHVLHSESCPRLNDHLIGVHGYRLNSHNASAQAKSSSFGIPAFHLGTSGAGRSLRQLWSGQTGKGTKTILNQAQCHTDDDTYTLTDEEAMLCPARTRGLSLTDKTWSFFLVEGTKPIEFGETAFESLALNPSSKKMIQGLVDGHDPDSPDFDDFIEGKGRGIILSLEGPTGSGKTLTAESIASLTKRILYRVSMSEVGTRADRAEIGLQRVFNRVERWKAIVLLDEADLFLSSRTEDNLERNALVTVFLRTLEYFKGIMILTSNRVEHFDPAFDSRIHFRVHFDDPSPETRKQIWDSLLSGDQPQDMTEELSRKYNINGRRIKNLIRVSVLIAKYRGTILTSELIDEVYSAIAIMNTATKLEKE
ncbi:ATPase family AAA domain-containing protein 3B like [Verticillium longisporum]|nr:ATPase family AAA domain-containing protein 3B like [Verticillium longisporum]